MTQTLTSETLVAATRKLATGHRELAHVYETYGTPPLWDRRPGFATLLHIILEQQFSLASARACFDKLTARIGDVSPENVLSLDDSEMKRVGFSRQKAAYARHLADAVLQEQLDLNGLSLLPDVEAKARLTSLKGVGEWTSDIYLLMALLRPDVMPRGDIALHAAWQRLSGQPRPSSDEFLKLAERWRPLRSVAARLLWHYYLSERAAGRRPQTSAMQASCQ